jgi:hypothetical protein
MLWRGPAAGLPRTQGITEGTAGPSGRRPLCRRPRFVRGARVTGRGASLEGDQVCVAKKRAVTQQPPDGGGVNVVGPRNIGLRLASSEALHGFLPLVRSRECPGTSPRSLSLTYRAALLYPAGASRERVHGLHQLLMSVVVTYHCIQSSADVSPSASL